MLIINHTICPECSIGCGINIISKNGKIMGINPYKNHPINEGKNCKNCTDNINNLTEYKQEKTYDYTNKIQEITEIIKTYPNNQITIITSGKTDNEDLEKIIDFTEKNKYNLLAYENNFTKTDKEQLATLEDIEEADQIIIIGDIYRKNSLIARRVIQAQQNNAKTININTNKNLTGYNTDELIEIDSYKNLTETLNTIRITPKTVILINEVEDYETIKNFVKENSIKILPLLAHPNSYSILEKIEKTSTEDNTNTINESKVLIFINEETTNFEEYDIKDKEIISITPLLSGKNNEIPVRQWCEKKGSFTNSLGNTQEFEDAVNDENNHLKTIGEVLEIITNNI